jgi:hypothetical protein
MGQDHEPMGEHQFILPFPLRPCRSEDRMGDWCGRIAYIIIYKNSKPRMTVLVCKCWTLDVPLPGVQYCLFGF